MIRYFSHETPVLPNKRMLSLWLVQMASIYGKTIGELNFIFCKNEYLLEINKSFLDHDYYTDVITFNNSENNSIIEGEIYISYDMVKDNAKTNNVLLSLEIYRIMAHGVLHLIGFEDSTNAKRALMHNEENKWISTIAINVPRGTPRKKTND